jgi:protein-S-isoprenylcysteine O-methyltransferase Ste14
MRTDPGPVLFLLGLVALCVIRWPYARRTRRNVVAVDRKDAQERILLAAVIAGGMVLPFLYVFTPWIDFADYRMPSGHLWAGGAVLLCGLYLLWRSHADLGQNWSPTLELRAEHTLVTRGVYAQVRHPMSAAAWLGVLAQALLLSNWIAGPAGLVTFGVMYVLRVPREEAMMIEHFGQVYREYVLHTNRLWPRRWSSRRRASEEVMG